MIDKGNVEAWRPAARKAVPMTTPAIHTVYPSPS